MQLVALDIALNCGDFTATRNEFLDVFQLGLGFIPDPSLEIWTLVQISISSTSRTIRALLCLTAQRIVDQRWRPLAGPS